MRPDILMRRDNRAILVADCKYKRLNAGDHRHHDLYQLLAYCTALDVSRGLLIYPLHVAAINDPVKVRNANVLIHEVVFDLDGDLRELKAKCDALAEFVFSLVGGECREPITSSISSDLESTA